MGSDCISSCSLLIFYFDNDIPKKKKKKKRKRTLITYSLYFSQHKKISVFYHKFGYDSLFLAATIDIQMSSKSVFVK